MSNIIPYVLGRCVTDVTSMITDKYGMECGVALRKFLFSETYRMLANPRLRMWDFTSEIIFEMWECEQITGNPRNSIYIRGAI